MKRFACIIGLTFALLAGIGRAQDLPWTRPSDLPIVIFNDRTVEFQTSLYPAEYATSAATDDIQWVRSHSGPLQTFWQQYGDSVLVVMSQLAGISWGTKELDVNLLRYYPTVGSVEPLVVPIGGIRVGALTEAIPQGDGQYFAVIYQLAHRLLWQGREGQSDVSFGLVNHPLMQPGPYLRDIVALHLALSTANIVLGADSTAAIYRSGFWQRHLTGHELYEQYIKNRWQLSGDKPLVEWLANEPSDSKMVQAATSLARAEEPGDTQQYGAIEGVSPKGVLGLSLRLNSDAQLVVDKIDPARSAYKSGLRAGDIINRVGGQRVNSHHEFIEAVLAGLDYGPVTVQVTRNGKVEVIIVRK